MSVPMAHGETILVVEDEVSILKLAKRILEDLGYTVITAGSPREALYLVAGYQEPINLLITDVVMPEMNGREMSSKLAELCPGLRTLFMSGYTANVIAHHGVLDEGINFIQKPFSTESLALKVREALDI
jgi:DNA-binding NtrC family response regulator